MQRLLLASASVSCAVCPSCQRNSVVRRNGRVTFSQRTTFAHWLMRIGRSRHDWIHFAYIVPMIASEVGRTTSRSSSSSSPPLRDPGDLRREALDVLGLLHQQALGNEQREVRVDVPGRLEPRVERLLDQLPDGVAVRTDDHAALDRRVVGQLGAADDVEIPAREVLGLRRDLGDLSRLLRACLLFDLFRHRVRCSRCVRHYLCGRGAPTARLGGSERRVESRFAFATFPVYIVAFRKIGRGSGRPGSPRGAAPPGRSAGPTVSRLAVRHCVGVQRSPVCSRPSSARDAGSSSASAVSRPCAVPEQPDVPPHQRDWICGVSADSAPGRRRARRFRPASGCTGPHWPVSTRAHRAARARAEHQPFQQRVAGQPVGAVHARARHLAGGEEPGTVVRPSRSVSTPPIM